MNEANNRPVSNDTDTLANRVKALVESPAYRPATDDPEFLETSDLRAVRLQLEYIKPELSMREQGIGSTIIVFGSARLLSGEQLDARCTKIDEQLSLSPENKVLLAKRKILEKRKKYVKYYDEARRFSAIVSKRFQDEHRCDFVVVTGGGPGIMEAANRGADDVNARSIGLNIDLPKEQQPNPFISPELCFQFRYFALRKLHFLMRAKALLAFPGGFGTFDELFEVLTLVQTKKVPPLPIVLMGREFWSKAINFDFLAEEGFISVQDLTLFKITDSADEALQFINDFYHGIPPE